MVGTGCSTVIANSERTFDATGSPYFLGDDLAGRCVVKPAIPIAIRLCHPKRRACFASIAHADPPTPPGARAPAARPEDPRRALGRLGENLAVAHLERRGFTILDRNYRTRHGEIDIVAFNGRAIAFVEVKTRRTRRTRGQRETAAPSPLEGLRPSQRARQRGLAGAWLKDHASRLRARDLRFDAIGVLLDRDDRLVRLDHIENAW